MSGCFTFFVRVSKWDDKTALPAVMESKRKKLKSEDCQNDISKIKEKPRKALKSGLQIKKERRKLAKNKIEEGDSNDGQSNSKKRKLNDEAPKSNKKFCKLNEPSFHWTDEEYLAESEDLSLTTARNIIDLFKKENTIPFIARYRGDLTDHLPPEKLRKIRSTYEYIQHIHAKAEQLIKQASLNNSVPPELLSCIQKARTVEELDFIGSRFKKDSKRSLAARAKELGLEPVAKLILEGGDSVVLTDLIQSKPGLENIENIKLGIQHIIADNISKDTEVHTFLDKIYSSNQVLLKSTFKGADVNKESSKYHLYGDFSLPINVIKPHQILAVNRGESENELSVKIIIPDFLWLPLKTFCNKKWSKVEKKFTPLLKASVDDAIKRLLAPLATRRIRAKLNEKAENEALDVFAINLQQLLMTPPYIGPVVMGIDPGFKHGCKLAVISPKGDLLAHDKFYLMKVTESRQLLKRLVLTYNCEVIALGNGTACRETEARLSEFINRGIFKPLNVSYTIIDEQGVSIYSCSEVAAEEFPGMDPKIVGAISLARRLQNPLSELVKVEPKHLGVGMYQHDVGEKKLVSTLDEVVSECVSFVGVDVNTASFYLLKRVAGLRASKAQEIIKYRTENCSFKSREDLKKVKGIKTKTFLQCAGFIRVVPSTARCTKHIECKNEFNPLDETCIHPESYEATHKIINWFGLNLDELGSENFRNEIKKKKETTEMEDLAKYCKCSVMVVEFILDSLMKPKNFDLRSQNHGPIFRKEIKNLEELSPGQVLEGVVRNVVNFGAFVDVGVGSNGLIHVSQMGNKSVQLNNRVRVKVKSTNLSPPRIDLVLVSVIQ